MTAEEWDAMMSGEEEAADAWDTMMSDADESADAWDAMFSEEEWYESDFESTGAETQSVMQTGQFFIAPDTAHTGMHVTMPAYSLALIGALILGLVMMHFHSCRKKLKDTTTLNFALLALPLGFVGARLFYVANRLSLFREIGMDKAWNVMYGGFGLWGAIGGAALAAVLCGKITRQKIRPIMDAAAAPAALVIGLTRLAEYFSGEGVGMMIENKALQFFPLAVCTLCEMDGGVVVYEEWRLAIFVVEALAAFIIMAVVLRTGEEDGRQSKMFLLLFCTVSLVLESLREDQYLRWQTLFVKVNQLTAALALTGLVVSGVVKWVRCPRERLISKGKVIVCPIAYVLLAGVCIGMEFALQKVAFFPNWACYLTMTVCAIGMGLCAWRMALSKKNKGR